nr:MAG TPA: Putative zinc ribbon domain [Caudoviricetes sp.]
MHSPISTFLLMIRMYRVCSYCIDNGEFAG